MSRRLGAIALDAVLAALILLWFAGGLSWHGRMILTHGADPRRAALLVAAAAALMWPALWEQSSFLRLARVLWQWLETRRGRWLALGLAFVLACVLGCLQMLALRVPMYDVGLFHQIIWAVAHGHGFLSTISGAGNFLLDHLAPSLALLVPAFWMSGSSALLLPILHAALIYSGVAAWIWLAESLGAPAYLAAGATLFGLSFDSLWGNLRWGFHENAIAFAALSWAFAWLMGKRPVQRGWVVALFVLAAASKEILLVDIALVFGAWAWLERKRSRSFALSLVASSMALLAIFVWFEKIHHPADKNYFDRYYMYLGHGLGEFFHTLLLSPWVVVQKVGPGELGRYFWTVLGPWLFLPLMAPKLARRESLWLVALLPSLASAALATYPPLRGSGFHYVLELWPVLAAVTLVVLSRLPKSWAIAWAFLALLAWDHDPLGDLREYGPGAVAAAPIRQAMSEIPVDASVAADELSGAWLASRMQVTRWPALPPDRAGQVCPQYLVLRGRDELAGAQALCGASIGLTRSLGDWYFVRTGSP